jgi:integrase
MAGRPRGTFQHVSFIEETDFKKLQKCLREGGGANYLRNLMVITLMYKTGLKTEEVAALRYCDVFDEAGSIQFQLSVGITKRKRIIRIDNAMQEALSVYRDNFINKSGIQLKSGEEIFKSQKGKNNTNFINRMIKNAFKNAGMPHHSSKSLQNGFIKRCLYEGKSFQYIATQIGETRIDRLIQRLALLSKIKERKE